MEKASTTSVALYGSGLSGGAMPHIMAAFRIFVPLGFDFLHSSDRRRIVRVTNNDKRRMKYKVD